MSELKEHQFCRYDEIVPKYSGLFPKDYGIYYLKSEADKVIAHHKYKRCLAMADLCFRECQTYCALIDRGEDHFGEMDFYGRWNKIWLILAEKFKEEK